MNWDPIAGARGRRVLMQTAALASTYILLGATWAVHFDPADPENRVGRIVASAVSGDTILVDPGVYYEHIPIEGKSLTFIGPMGPASTILDGERLFPDREGSIVYQAHAPAADLRMQGFTLRNGSGTVFYLNIRYGGAIFMDNGVAGGAYSLALSNCVFDENGLSEHGDEGGAIFANGVANVAISACAFSNNTAPLGGAVSLYAGHHTEISNCRFAFVRPDGWFGDAWALHSYGETLLLDGNSFDTTGEEFASNLMRLEDLSQRVVRNTFVARGGTLGTRLFFCWSGFGNVFREATLEDNVFWNANGGSPGDGVYILFAGGHVECLRNTFVAAKLNVSVGNGPPLICANNIFYRTPVSLGDQGGGSIQCNDAWPDSIVPMFGNLVFSDNARADPRFCGESAGDFHIESASPCAPGHSPNDCSLIGAEEVGCISTPTKSTTWGAIKSSFK
jgi:hypothetical protein